MTVTERIDSLIQQRGLSRRQLAIAADIPPSSLQSALERGKNITLDMLQSIAAALDIPVWQLLPADQEPDRDYELICDTLADAGLCIEPTGFGEGPDADGDYYYVWHADAEDPEEDRVEYTFRDLLRIVKDTHKWADANRFEYMRKRLEIELF